MISQDVVHELAIAEKAAGSAARRRWPLFIIIGAILYLALYLYSEHLVYEHGKRSRLFMIPTAPQQSYDAVILGASHAMPFGFNDNTERLQTLTNSSIINLSIEGGGLVPARFFLDYFLQRHTTKNVIYILNSFAFYSRAWNEDRIDDVKLFKRAPFDPALLPILWKYKSTRELIPGYISGFYKINNPDRFEPDINDAERNEFTHVYRTNPYLDKQRIAYLYPKPLDQALYEHYFDMFKNFTAFLHQRSINLIVVRTPLPKRVLSNLTGEDEFDQQIQKILEPYNFPFHDFSQVSNEDPFFYDTDHLNKNGVNKFVDEYLAQYLKTEIKH